MESGGPMQSALMAQARRAQPEEKTISDDQIKQLLIFMGTITIVSFVLVVALITVFIAFIWYSRGRLHRCNCSHSHDKEKQQMEGGRSGGQGGAFSPLSSPPRPGRPVKMFAVPAGHFQLVGGHKSVIVNPLSRQARASPALSTRDLEPAINQSALLEQARIYRLHQVDQIESTQSLEEIQTLDEEPIYTEIKPKILANVEEKEEKVPEEEDTAVSNSGKKKEVEYWQITAKEVVKFRPCTETFIQRE